MFQIQNEGKGLHKNRHLGGVFILGICTITYGIDQHRSLGVGELHTQNSQRITITAHEV